MSEIIIIAGLVCFYFFISYLVYRQLIKTKKLLFAVISVVYLLFTYFFLFLFVNFDGYIVPTGFYRALVQIDQTIMSAFFICTFTAFINIIAAMAGREKGKEMPDEPGKIGKLPGIDQRTFILFAV
jgi:hypothetical protein